MQQCGTGIADYYSADLDLDELYDMLIVKGTPLFEKYAKLFRKMHFIGWDIAVKENCDIELIEANFIPDLANEQLFYGLMVEKFRNLYESREYGK